MLLNKYYLSLPLGTNGEWVAASTPEEAIRQLLPDDGLKVVDTARSKPNQKSPRWVVYEVDRDLAPCWPRENIDNMPGSGGRRVDVEYRGQIHVAQGPGNKGDTEA